MKSEEAVTCVTAALHPIINLLSCYRTTTSHFFYSLTFKLSSFTWHDNHLTWKMAKNRNQDTVGKNNKLTLHSQRRWIIHPIFSFLPLNFHRKHSLLSIFIPIFLLLLHHQNFIYSSVFSFHIFLLYVVSLAHTHRPTSHIIEQFVQMWITFHIHKRHHQSCRKASDTHLAILAQICTKPSLSNPIIRLSYTNAVVNAKWFAMLLFNIITEADF